MAARPERQCIGCGKRGPQGEFVRLCVGERKEPADDKTTKIVVVGRGLKGRGAYLCRKQACLDRALYRKALQRAFRTTVVVDEDQIRRALRAADVEE